MKQIRVMGEDRAYTALLLTLVFVAIGCGHDSGSSASSSGRTTHMSGASSSSSSASSSTGSGGSGGAGGTGASSVTTGTGASGGAGTGGDTTSTSGTGGTGGVGTGGDATTSTTGTGGTMGSSTTSTTGTASSSNSTGSGTGGATTSSSSSSSSSVSSSASTGSGTMCLASEKLCGGKCVLIDDPNYGCGQSCGASCGINQMCEANACTTPTFGCWNWNRKPLFDAQKVSGGLDLEHPVTPWGTSKDNFYVLAAANAPGFTTVFHWNGLAFVHEDLDAANPPTEGSSISGTSDNDVWVAARCNGVKGCLFHRSGGVWTADTHTPNAKGFSSIYSIDVNNVVLVGVDNNWLPSIWLRSGVNWVKQTLPASLDITKLGLSAAWAQDASHILVTGTLDFDLDSAPDQGVLLSFDGSVWTSVPGAPANVELTGVHGTSINDVFVAGVLKTGRGAVYRLRNVLGSWSTILNDPNVDGYGPIFSRYVGTFITAGYKSPAVEGSLRVTTVDQMESPMQPVTQAIDSKGFNPVGIWHAPGSDLFYMTTVAVGGSPAGLYEATCN